MTQKVHATLLGLNRYTASFGLALREYSQQPKSRLQFVITGFDDDREKMKQAQQMGAVDDLNNRMGPAVRSADFVLLSQPPDNLPFTYEVIGDLLKPGAVVLDMSFHKVDVSALARQFFLEENGVKRAYLVNVHPLVHSDYLLDPRQELSAAAADLFKNNDLLIAPEPNTPEEAVKLAADLAEILSMTPRFVDPAEYQSLVDFTENLPVLMAMLMFAGLQGSSGARELERSINPTFALMMQHLRFLNAKDVQQLWQHNRQSTLRHLDAISASLERLRDAFEQDDPAALKQFVESTLNAYSVWERQRATGEWEKLPMSAAVSSRASLLTGLFGFGGRKKGDGEDKSPQT